MKEGILRRLLSSLMVVALIATYSVPTTVFAGSELNRGSDWQIEKKEGKAVYYKFDQKMDGGKGGFADTTENTDPVTRDKNGNVTVSETIEKTSEENYFDINLTVETKQTVEKTVETKVSQDLAAVLVVDMSSSMTKYKVGGETRLAVAKTAAVNFVDAFVTDAGDSKRYISLVLFGENAWSKKCGGEIWVDVSNEKSRKAFKKLIEDIDPESVENGTNVDAGLYLAKNILAMDTISKVANKYTVLLTDGASNNMVVTETTSTTDIKKDRKEIKRPVDGTYEGNKASADAAEKRAGEIKKISTLYTICFGAKNDKAYEESGAPTVSAWLKKFANAAFDADDSIKLNESFIVISELIKRTANAWRVTSPLGEYIEYAQEKDIPGVTFDSEKKILIWDLRNQDVKCTELKDKGGKKIGEKYEMTYRVRLNTAALPDKIKNIPIEEYYHKVNGHTSLSYFLTVNGKYVDQDGKEITYDNINDVLQSIDFVNPAVKGELPQVNYSINYYKWNWQEQKYEQITKDTIIGQAKVHTLLKVADKDPGYETKYDNYSFAVEPSTISKTLTNSAEANVLNLYYMPIKADVTVNHFYKTDVIGADGQTVKGDYIKGENSGALTGDYYIGEKFCAEAVTTHAFDGSNLTYNVDYYKVGDNKYQQSPEITLNKDAAKNEVNIYYSYTVDNRKDASYIVYRQYETGEYAVNKTTGRYEVIYTPSDAAKYSEGSKKAYDSVATSTTDNVTEGYVYNRTVDNTNEVTYDKDNNTVSMQLKEGSDNHLTTVFRKEPTDNRKAATIEVEHKYHRVEVYIEDGVVKTKDETFTTTEAITGYYVGETFNPQQNKYYAGEEYKPSKKNKSVEMPQTINEGKNTFTFNYSLNLAPDVATVIVQHHYLDKKLITSDSGINEEIYVENDKARNIVYYPESEEEGTLHYAGEYFGPKLVGVEGYTFYDADGTPTAEGKEKAGKVLEAKENVINVYYVSDNTIDDRKAADVNVQHIYITYTKTVVDGRVQIVTSRALGDLDDIKGQVGDKVTATPKPEYNGKKYTQKTSDEALTTTLKLGTNSTIEIVYERDDTDLKDAALIVIYKLVNHTKEIVDGIVKNKDITDEVKFDQADVVAADPDDSTKTIKLDKNLYAGEVYDLEIPETYTHTDNLEYTQATSGNDDTHVILGEDINTRTYTYEVTTDLPKTTITVVRHLETVYISTDGTVTTTPAVTTPEVISLYAGLSQDIDGNYPGYQPKGDDWQVIKNAENSSTSDKNLITVLTSTAAVTVDLYYTRLIDDSKPVTGEVRHHFVDIDWTGAEKENLDALQKTPIYSFATKDYTADILKGTGYEFNADRSDKLTITLVQDASKNVINLYYFKKVEPTENKVTVFHHYTKHDTYGRYADEVVDTRQDFGKDEGAWIGNTLNIELIPSNGGILYTYKSAKDNHDNALTPDAEVIKVAVVAGVDVIDIYYVYEYSSYQPSNPGHHSGGGSDKKPTTNIPDEDVPMGDKPADVDIPDEDVPLSDLPEEVVIEDEEVPLADLPITGGMGVGLFLLAGAALAGAGLGLRRKDDEE